MLDTSVLPVKFFPEYYINKHAMFRATAKCNVDRWIMPVISTSTGKNEISPSHLLGRKNGDLSFLLYFSKECLVENIQEKFQKIHR